MAGYASQTNYEADLLQTYLKRGRVSPISKRDVNLALSIYKMPNIAGATGKGKKLTYGTARRYARGKNDSQIMRVAIRSVLNQNLAQRKADAAAKKAARSVPTYNPPTSPPPAAPASTYTGSLTPPPSSTNSRTSKRKSPFTPPSGGGGGYSL